MKHGAIVGVLLIAACSWSNSLYQARELTASAQRAEREHNPNEAQTDWGQAVVKAESAYARSPHGKRGVEALWLAGQAESQNNDCAHAVPTLQAALFTAPHARWRQRLLLDLGLCAEASDRPTAIATYTMLLASSPDSEVRRTALLHEGHVFVMQGQWDNAETALAGQDTLPARADRAMALAHLGRAREALANLDPLIAAGDTSVRWIDYIEEMARQDPPAADTLLLRLRRLSSDSVLVKGHWQQRVSEAQQSAWLLAATQAAATRHPAAADRWLAELSTRAPSPAVTDGRYFAAQLAIVRSASIGDLTSAVALFPGLPEGSLGAYHLADLLTYSRWMIARDSSVRPGAAGGDLAMFTLGELARDSLGAPALGAWFFARIERDWPQSPYLPKALLARIPLEPDSGATLLARAQSHGDNPYIAAANGDVASQLRVARLEYALGQYIDGWGRAPHAPGPSQGRE